LQAALKTPIQPVCSQCFCPDRSALFTMRVRLELGWLRIFGKVVFKRICFSWGVRF